MSESQLTGNLSNTERAWSAILGASLCLFTLRRGNAAARSVQAAAGAALLARAFAGHCGVKAAMSGHSSLSEGLRDQLSRLQPQRHRSAEGLPGSPAHAAKSRAIDEGVAESFPASDPPASRLPDEPPANAEAKWKAARAAQDTEPAGSSPLVGDPVTGD